MPQRTFRPDAIKIDKLRVQRGWSLGELATRARCSLRTIDSVLDGKDALISTIKKIADALGLSPEAILIGYEPQPSPESLEKRYTIHLNFALHFEYFDECEQLESLIAKVAELIHAKQPIIVTNTLPGSIVVTVEMAESDILRLLTLFADGTAYSLPLNVNNPVILPDVSFLLSILHRLPIAGPPVADGSFPLDLLRVTLSEPS